MRASSSSSSSSSLAVDIYTTFGHFYEGKTERNANDDDDDVDNEKSDRDVKEWNDRR